VNKKKAAAIFAEHATTAGTSGYGIESIACSCDRTWRTVAEWREHMARVVASAVRLDARDD